MEEINFIRPEELYNRNTGESKVRYNSYDGGKRFIPVVDDEDGVPRTLVVTTHAKLVTMRDGGKLIAGALYRITDYQCTTTQEGTQSAGHQFDIVLLALSENKLAEEGWAMEHPTDVYDVTFQGNYHNPITVRKCYIYCIDIENNRYNIVDCETLLGISGTNGDGEDFIIDEINKTCDATLYGVDNLNEENLTYNYFQNSKLEAWKVWYCLDNDKSRFAWADATNGKGVIYRLIDEWNNDVPYDFKNIQFVRPMTDGEYDLNGENTWAYTFNAYNADEGICYDATMINGIKIDDGETCCKNNYFTVMTNPSQRKLNYGIVYCVFSIENGGYYEAHGLCNITGSSSFVRCFNVTSYFGSPNSLIEDGAQSIYIHDEKVLTES